MGRDVNGFIHPSLTDNVFFTFSRFTIGVPGFGEVELDINFICRCECEAKSNQVCVLK